MPTILFLKENFWDPPKKFDIFCSSVTSDQHVDVDTVLSQTPTVCVTDLDHGKEAKKVFLGHFCPLLKLA